MKLLSLGLVLVSIPGVAQIKNFSIALAPNYPMIDRSSQAALLVKDITPIPTGVGYGTVHGTVKEAYHGKVGVTLYGSMDVGISRKLFITSGVSVSYLRFKRNVTIESVKFGIWPSGSFYAFAEPASIGSMYGYTYGNKDGKSFARPSPSQYQGQTTALYVEVPVLAGTAVFAGKLNIRAGAVSAYFIRATEYRTRLEGISPNVTMQEYKEGNPNNFTNVLVGALAEASYQLKKSISANFTARRYFHPVYKKDSRYGSNAHYNLLSVGMCYTFRY